MAPQGVGVLHASGANAHGANEWPDVTSLTPTMKVIGAAALDLCGLADGWRPTPQ